MSNPSLREPAIINPLQRDNAILYNSDGGAGELTDDDLDLVVVAIDVRDSGTIGCSYYSTQEETLYLLGDMPSFGSEILDTCLLNTAPSSLRDAESILVILQTEPTVLLTSPRVEHFDAQQLHNFEREDSK